MIIFRNGNHKTEILFLELNSKAPYKYMSHYNPLLIINRGFQAHISLFKLYFETKIKIRIHTVYTIITHKFFRCVLMLRVPSTTDHMGACRGCGSRTRYFQIYDYYVFLFRSADRVFLFNHILCKDHQSLQSFEWNNTPIDRLSYKSIWYSL